MDVRGVGQALFTIGLSAGLSAGLLLASGRGLRAELFALLAFVLLSAAERMRTRNRAHAAA